MLRNKVDEDEEQQKGEIIFVLNCNIIELLPFCWLRCT